MASSSDSGLRTSGLLSSPVHFQTSHFIDQCTTQEGVHRDVQRFIALPSYPESRHLTDNHHARDLRADTWPEQ